MYILLVMVLNSVLVQTEGCKEYKTSPRYIPCVLDFWLTLEKALAERCTLYALRGMSMHADVFPWRIPPGRFSFLRGTPNIPEGFVVWNAARFVLMFPLDSCVSNPGSRFCTQMKEMLRVCMCLGTHTHMQPIIIAHTCCMESAHTCRHSHENTHAQGIQMSW